jgi:Conjugal transfer protein TrbH
VRRACRSMAIGLITVSTLSGCVLPASSRVSGSYVEEVPGIDATKLAQATSNALAQIYPPANTIFVLDPAPTESGFGTGFRVALTQAGFAVADSASAAQVDRAHAHPLRYRVLRFDGEALVQVDVDDRQLTQLYAADTAGLVAAASAPTVRER